MLSDDTGKKECPTIWYADGSRPLLALNAVLHRPGLGATTPYRPSASASAVGAALRRHVRWVLCRQGGVHISYPVVTWKKEPGAYRLHALWTFCRKGCAKYAQNSCPKLCTLPVLPFGKHALWACRHCFSHPNMPGWPLPCFGRSEQRSATRLRTALADQNDGLLPIHMPFSTHALQAPLSPRHRSLSTYHHCNHYNMTTTACLLNIPSARIRAVSSKQLPKARHPAGATVC